MLVISAVLVLSMRSQIGEFRLHKAIVHVSYGFINILLVSLVHVLMNIYDKSK